MSGFRFFFVCFIYAFTLFSTVFGSDCEILDSKQEEQLSTPQLSKIIVVGGEYINSPVRRGLRQYSKIVIRDCTFVGTVDAGCFTDQPYLELVSFEGSNINFGSLSYNRFGLGCLKLKEINFCNTEGVTLKSFIESIAAPETLKRIRHGECVLHITRAKISEERLEKQEEEKLELDAKPISGKLKKEALKETYSTEEIYTIIDLFLQKSPMESTFSTLLRKII